MAPVIDQAIGRLPDDLRMPIILHYLQGCRQEDIAAQLGVDQATVSLKPGEHHDVEVSPGRATGDKRPFITILLPGSVAEK